MRLSYGFDAESPAKPLIRLPPHMPPPSLQQILFGDVTGNVMFQTRILKKVYPAITINISPAIAASIRNHVFPSKSNSKSDTSTKQDGHRIGHDAIPSHQRVVILLEMSRFRTCSVHPFQHARFQFSGGKTYWTQTLFAKR